MMRNVGFVRPACIVAADMIVDKCENHNSSNISNSSKKELCKL